MAQDRSAPRKPPGQALAPAATRLASPLAASAAARPASRLVPVLPGQPSGLRRPQAERAEIETIFAGGVVGFRESGDAGSQAINLAHFAAGETAHRATDAIGALATVNQNNQEEEIEA